MRGPVRNLAGAALIAAFALSIASAAHADVIDGEWCKGTSHFIIDGPNILTPGGNHIQGAYTRHSFVYTVPANEPDAGSEIRMLLLNEENVRLTRAAGPQPEIWQRCRPTS